MEGKWVRRCCLLLKVQSLVLKLKSTYVDGFALFLGLIVALGLVGWLVVGGGSVVGGWSVLILRSSLDSDSE